MRDGTCAEALRGAWLRAGRGLPGRRCAGRHRRHQPGRQLQHLARQLGLQQLLRRLRDVVGAGLHPRRQPDLGAVRHVAPQPLLRQPDGRDARTARRRRTGWTSGGTVRVSAHAGRRPPRTGAEPRALPGAAPTSCPPAWARARYVAEPGKMLKLYVCAQLRPGRAADSVGLRLVRRPRAAADRGEVRLRRGGAARLDPARPVVAAAARLASWRSVGVHAVPGRAGHRRVRHPSGDHAADARSGWACSGLGWIMCGVACAAAAGPGLASSPSRWASSRCSAPSIGDLTCCRGSPYRRRCGASCSRSSGCRGRDRRQPSGAASLPPRRRRPPAPATGDPLERLQAALQASRRSTGPWRRAPMYGLPRRSCELALSRPHAVLDR